MFKATFLTGLLFCLSLHIFAQKNTASTEKREMFFRIGSITKLKSDSIKAKILGGKKLGISIGTTGVVKGVYKSGNDRSDLEIGYGIVIKI